VIERKAALNFNAFHFHLDCRQSGLPAPDCGNDSTPYGYDAPLQLAPARCR